MPPRGQPRIWTLQQRPDLDGFAGLLLAHRGDGSATARGDFDQAFGCETTNGLPHRVARDPQFICKAPLDQAVARLQPSAQDRLTKLLDHLAVEREVLVTKTRFGGCQPTHHDTFHSALLVVSTHLSRSISQ